MFRLLLIALAVSLGSSVSVEDCPFGMARDKYLKVFGTSCYRFNLAAKLDYEDAAKECKKENGFLALVDSEAENDFLVNTLRNDFTDEYEVWIGLNDMDEENTFVWDDGRPYNVTGFNKFADNEGPRKSFVQSEWEDCVGLDPEDGMWHDYHCRSIFFLTSAMRYYVCENAI